MNRQWLCCGCLAVRRTSAAICLTLLLVAATAAQQGIEVSQSATFVTTNRSLFGTNEAFLFARDPSFIGFAWDRQGQNSIQLQVGDPNTNGVLVNASTKGRLGLESQLRIDGGRLSSVLSYDAKLKLPTFDDFKTGSYEISVPAATFKSTDSSFNTSSPSFQFYSEFVVEAEATLSGQAAFTNPFSGTVYGGSFNQLNLIPTIDLRNDQNNRYRLISFNQPIDPQVPGVTDKKLQLLPALQSIQKLFGKKDIPEEVLDGIEVNPAKRKVTATLDLLSFSAALDTGSILSTSFNLPLIKLGDAIDRTTPNVLKQAGKDELASLRIDMGALVSTVFPNIPPLKAKVEHGFAIGSVSVSAAAVDTAFVPRLDLTQTAAVHSNGVAVTLALNRQAMARLVNADGQFPEGQNYVAITAKTLKTGQKLQFQEGLDPQDLIVTPTYAPDALLESKFGVSLGSSVTVDLLKGDVKGDLLGFDLPKQTFGPALAASLDLGNTPLANFFAPDPFELGGFNTVRGGRLILTASGNNWLGTVDNSMFTNGNWHTGLFQLRQDLQITSGTAVADNTRPDLGAVKEVGSLKVRGGGQVKIDPNIELKVIGDIELGGSSSQAGLLVREGGTVRLANSAVNPPNPLKTEWTLSGPGILRLDGTLGLPAKLIAEQALTVASGGIDGFGDVQVAQTLKLDGGMLKGSVASRTLNITADKLQFVGNSNSVSSIGTSANSALKLTTTMGIERVLGTEENRLLLMASDTSTLTLDVASIDSARFMGTGQIILDRNNMELSNVVNDGLLETTKTIKLATGIVQNNNKFTVKAGGALEPTGVSLAGAGTVELQSAAANGAAINVPGGQSFVNEGAHTISATGAANEKAKLQGTFSNLGIVRATGTTLEMPSGSMTNSGTFEATSSGRIEMTGTSTLNNLSATGDLTLTNGRYRLADGTSTMRLRTTNTSTNFINRAKIELAGPRAEVDKSGFTIDANGTVTDLFDLPSFLNESEGELILGTGRKFITTQLTNHGYLTLQGTAELGNVTNQPGGIVQATLAAPDATTDAIVRLKTNNNIATNAGVIQAVKAPDATGSLALTVKSQTNGTPVEFSNMGVVEVRNATMTFQDLKLNSGAVANSFNGGTGVWIIEGRTGTSDGTLNLQVDLPAPPSVLAANLAFIGPFSFLNVNGARFQDTLVRNDGLGILTLKGRDMEFANALTNDGMIVLGGLAEVVRDVNLVNPNDPDSGITSNSTVGKIVRTKGIMRLRAPVNANSVTLTNNNALAGAGVIDARSQPQQNKIGVIENSPTGIIMAEDGELTFQDALVVNSGDMVAIGPDEVNDVHAGAIGLDRSTIAGGNVDIEPGAALGGNGLLTNVDLTNDGFVVTRGSTGFASPQLLQIDLDGTVINNGAMVATYGQTLALNGGTLDNPGKLLILPTLEPETDDFLNGKMLLSQTTVDGGTLQVEGVVDKLVDDDQNPNTPPVFQPAAFDKHARVTGRNATLNGVTININAGAVVADQGLFFSVAPAFGTVARIADSTVLATDGSTLTLIGPGGPGEYQLFGTTVKSTGTGMNLTPSKVLFSGATVRGGLLKTENGGEMRVVQSSRFIDVSSEANVVVDANKTLTLAQVFQNRNNLNGNSGTLTVNGTLLLDGSQPIGGTGNITSGSDLLAGNVNINAGAKLQVAGKGRVLGANLANNGSIELVAGNELTINHSLNNINSAPNFPNAGVIDVAATAKLEVQNNKLTNTGNVKVDGQVVVGIFEQSAGSLSGSGQLMGNLSHTGGLVSPGSSAGTLSIAGSYTEAAAGNLHIELAGTSSFDKLAITGSASLAGQLETVLIGGFNPAAGNSFQILTSAGITGTFSSTVLPTLSGNLVWTISYSSNSVTLAVTSPGLPGDFNHDGFVNAADYVVWRKGLGTIFVQSDYNVWRSHFGQTTGSGSIADANAAVPEPATLALLMFTTIGWCLRRGRPA